MQYGYIKGKQVVIDLWPIGDGFYLEMAAAQDFLRMKDAAAAVGITLVVNRAFATWAQQSALYRKYQILKAAWDKAGRLGKRPAPAAQPGFSTHQCGWTVDINRAPGDDPTTAAYDSPTDLWLQANAALYGFVNDVASEPWHYTHTPKQDRIVA